jgi:hypothetical protein
VPPSTEPPTTTTTTSSTTTSTVGAVACSPSGLVATLGVPYDEVGAPELSGVQLSVQYAASVSIPNIPGTPFVDPSRLLDLTGLVPFLLAQDADTNADTVEDRMTILFSVTNTVFPPGALLNVTFDCNAGMVSPGDLVCTVTGASDRVGNDVANPGAIPCRVTALGPA